MPKTYKYGMYGSMGDTKAQVGVSAATTPVYIGTLPVHLVRGYRDMDLVNHPIRVKSLADAQANAGYVNDFERYTLCEAIAAHFDNGGEAVGPIYLINVLDPARASVEHCTVEAAIANGKAEIPGTDIILDSVAIALPPVDGEYQTAEFRANGPAGTKTNYKYAEAYAAAGITFKGGVIGYEPTGNIVPEIVNGNYVYAGITFEAPAGATRATLKVDGQTKADDVDLSAESEHVTKGKLIQYFAVATADGAKLDPKHWDVTVEWDTPEGTVVKECRIGRYNLDYTEGSDYALTYSAARSAVLIEDVNRIMPPTVTVSYDVINPESVTVEDIIGHDSNGDVTGIYAAKLLFMEDGKIPNILAAPGWSHIPSVYRTLCQVGRHLNGHWDAFIVADMPIEDGGKLLDSFDAIIKWKSANQYGDERSKVYWPMAVDINGRKMHLSALAVAEMLRLDQSHGGIPMETCGNKPVNIVRQYFGEDSRNKGFDKTDALEITQHGISTVAPWGATWTLWGDHTAAYDFDIQNNAVVGENAMDPRVIFDPSIRMLMYLTNAFQVDHASKIDKPMTRALKDTIINLEQAKLDSLVTMGALIGSPTIEFTEDLNSTDEVMNGNFTWSIEVTPTPPLKSATAIVTYTTDGFASYFDGEE